VEGSTDALWRCGDHGHVLLGHGFEFRFRAHRRLGADRALHVGVDALVGIELGGVAGQVEHLDAVDTLREPGPLPAWNDALAD
jgi:hypothetical protein